MALQLAGAGVRVKALIPNWLGLTARSGKNSAAVEPGTATRPNGLQWRP